MLAYVLLCRDIELACDEKVIKELDNELRADYAQALVVCSVNRRMIAACPLAFGEVGVKERVKSVMNYKKPAFWVIIIAVIICVGVAVCFLTNPKQDRYTLRIVVPAGSQEEFVYTEEESAQSEIQSKYGLVMDWVIQKFFCSPLIKQQKPDTQPLILRMVCLWNLMQKKIRGLRLV